MCFNAPKKEKKKVKERENKNLSMKTYHHEVEPVVP